MSNKSGRQISKVRLTFFLIFTALILASVILVAISPDISIDGADRFSANIFKVVAVGLVFLMSLCLLKINKKSIFITISLIAYCVAVYFLFSLDNTKSPDDIALAKDIMLYALLAYALVLAIYTIILAKGVGLKVLNIAVRIALSVIAYFVLTEYLPEYFDLKNSLFIIYLVNSIITVLFLCFHFKTHYLIIIGLLLATIGSVFYAFSFGWITLFNITGDFVKFINSFDYGFILTIIGIYLTGCEAVFSGMFKNNRLSL